MRTGKELNHYVLVKYFSSHLQSVLLELEFFILSNLH